MGRGWMQRKGHQCSTSRPQLPVLLLLMPPLLPSAPARAPYSLQQFTQTDTLRKIFSEYGDVSHCYMPRSATNPNACKGFAFVQFKHSFAADA
jgi:hypothetical protein